MEKQAPVNKKNQKNAVKRISASEGAGRRGERRHE
jgi:hypothetical protein